MHESTQVNIAPNFFGRNYADLGEFSPNQQIFGWKLDEIRPNRNKFAHKFWGELNCADSPVFGRTRITVYFKTVALSPVNR
jgi:hypothetical protein